MSPSSRILIASCAFLMNVGVMPAAAPIDPTKEADNPKISNPRWITEPSVQTELKLTAEQSRKISTALEDARAQLKDEIARSKAAEAAGRFDLAKETYVKVWMAEEKALVKAIPATLTARQLVRLRQMEWHLTGLHNAILDPMTMKRLDLSKKQKEQFKGIMDGVRAEAAKHLPPGQAADPALLDALQQKFIHGITGKFLDILTPEQKAVWKDLTGEPFQFPQPILPPK